jgi:hypothetical protein
MPQTEVLMAPAVCKGCSQTHLARQLVTSTADNVVMINSQNLLSQIRVAGVCQAPY